MNYFELTDQVSETMLQNETQKKRSLVTVNLYGCPYKVGRVAHRVLLALKRGKLTAAEICQVARVTDPRGHISRLRRKGIGIDDITIKSPDGTYCKRYFLAKRRVDHE